jgi:hypothetical protein
MELETRRGGANGSVGKKKAMILILNLRYSRASEVVTPDLQQVWLDEIMESVRSV